MTAWPSARQLAIARRRAPAIAWQAYDFGVNVLVVFLAGQLALPPIGFHPPTLLAAFGLVVLVAVLRSPLRISEWIRRG